MKYSRAPFPRPLFALFNELAKALGYDKRGERWKLLYLLFTYAASNSDLFRKR